jgi:hypothetical protein
MRPDPPHLAIGEAYFSRVLAGGWLHSVGWLHMNEYPGSFKRVGVAKVNSPSLEIALDSATRFRTLRIGNPLRCFAAVGCERPLSRPRSNGEYRDA